MYHTIKIDGQSCAVNTPSTQMLIVHDDGAVYTASGGRIPPAEVHARRLATEAEQWIALAVDRTRMKPHTIARKGLQSLAFSASKGAGSFAVPTKLVGVGRHQPALWRLVREHVAPWTELALSAEDGEFVAYHDGERLGSLQRKHEGWVRLLVPFGLTLHLSRVTGTDYDGYTLGVNIVLGHVGEAVCRLRDALSSPVGGDGERTSGDGAASGAPLGDGAAARPPVLAPPRETVRRTVRVLPEHAAIDADSSPDDIVLWRDLEGRAHASVPHVVRHSPTGIEFGYAGSGPADLALSVLTALVDRETAEALYHDFKAEVVRRVPEAGGVLRASEVRAWAETAVPTSRR